MPDRILDLEQAMVVARQASDDAQEQSAMDEEGARVARTKADLSAQAARDAKAAHMKAFVELGSAIQAENSPSAPVETVEAPLPYTASPVKSAPAPPVDSTTI